jgi:general secretion pathway protein I
MIVPQHRPRNATGFSLVEVMVALLILGFAVAGLAQGITTAIRSTKDSERQTVAAFLAAGRVELLRAELEVSGGVTEGQGGTGLAQFRWTETVRPTSVAGLHEVTVLVRHAEESAPLYELRTLLFDPPGGSRTNGPAAADRSSRNRDAGRSPR